MAGKQIKRRRLEKTRRKRARKNMIKEHKKQKKRRVKKPERRKSQKPVPKKDEKKISAQKTIAYKEMARDGICRVKEKNRRRQRTAPGPAGAPADKGAGGGGPGAPPVGAGAAGPCGGSRKLPPGTAAVRAVLRAGGAPQLSWGSACGGGDATYAAAAPLSAGRCGVAERGSGAAQGQPSAGKLRAVPRLLFLLLPPPPPRRSDAMLPRAAGGDGAEP